MSGFNNIKHYFSDLREYEKLLDAAAKSAETDWQINFVSDIEAAYEKYGSKARLTQKQYDSLVDIAGW